MFFRRADRDPQAAGESGLAKLLAGWRLMVHDERRRSQAAQPGSGGGTTAGDFATADTPSPHRPRRVAANRADATTWRASGREPVQLLVSAAGQVMTHSTSSGIDRAYEPEYARRGWP